MAIWAAILLGVGLYFLAALPVAVVVGRLLAGPADRRPVSAPRPGITHVALGGPVALVARHPHAGRDLQLAGAEAHPAHA